MNENAWSIDRGRAVTVALLSTAFLWAIALSALPQLHTHIHANANSVEHTCAVTLIGSGSCNHSTNAAPVSAPLPTVLVSNLPILTPQWVESPFLAASIFEHAPPALA